MPTHAHEDTPFGQLAQEGCDAASLRSRMTEYAVPHTVEPVAGDPYGTTAGFLLGDARLAFVRYGAPVRVVAAPTQDTMCWTIPVGTMGVRTGDVRGSMREGFFLDGSGTTEMLPDPSQGAVVLTVPEPALRRHLEHLTGRVVPPLHWQPGPSLAPTRGQTMLAWQHVANSLRHCTNPPDALRKAHGETLLSALLAELPVLHEHADDDPGHTPRGLAQQAADWAHDHHGEPVRTRQWAQALNISVRQLQLVVREAFDCTPSEYLLRLRLDHARRLLESPHEQTVTSVALHCGFTHLGRFSATFRERFGVTPAQVRRGAKPLAKPVESI